MNTKKRFSMMIAFLLAFSVIASMPLQASAANVFADGEYTVPFTVLKDTSNEVSTTADYMVSPAKVHMQNDKATVTVTLNNSSWWQYFKVNGRDVQVVSENTGTDKRVVKFDVADLNQLVNAKIHIIVTGIPGFNYDNEYDIRFKFNTASIPAPAPEKPVVTPPAKEEKPPVKPKPEPKPEAKPETKPESKPVTKLEVKPESKPSDKKEEVSKTEDKGLVVKKEEKIDSDKEAEEGKTETESSEVEEDEAVEENSADPENLDIQEEVEVDEEPTIKESAVEEVDSDKDESSNTGLFITLAVVIIALIAGLAAYFASKKRARK